MSTSAQPQIVVLSREAVELLLGLGARPHETRRPTRRWLGLAIDEHRRRRAALAERQTTLGALMTLALEGPLRRSEAQHQEWIDQLEYQASIPRSVGLFDKQLAETEELDAETIEQLDYQLAEDIAANEQLGDELDGLSSASAEGEDDGVGSDGDTSGGGDQSGEGSGGEGGP